MGFFENIRKTLAGAYRSTGPSDEVLAALTPAQRARYERNMAQVEEAHRTVAGDHLRLRSEHARRFAARPLQGPAGEHLYGPATYPGADPAELRSLGPAEQVEHSLQQATDQFRDLLRNPSGRPPPVAPSSPPPVPGATVAPTRDPVASERHARDAARAPYTAAGGPPVAFTRLATRGRTQLEELASHLASSGLAARPDLVYGVYRVPDRLSPDRMGSEQRRVVEWDIVHAALERLPPASEPPVSTWFAGEEQWVARAVGEPSILDEDLAAEYLVRAGIGPEQTLGVARVLSIVGHSGGPEDGSRELWSRVDGVCAFHAPSLGATTYEQMAASRPLDLPSGPPPGVHTEVLTWEPVQRAVHPRIHRPPASPSPFPYLPSTPQELLRAYLEVVGIRPDDSYGVQATTDEARDLAERTELDGILSTGTDLGPPQPCADGTDRPRLAGTKVVVITYRDRPEYEAGRARWIAFQHEVYQGDLRRETGARRPVETPIYEDLPPGLRGLAKAADIWERVTSVADAHLDDPPHRYCWPPVVRG